MTRISLSKKVTCVFVIGQERLYSDLKRIYPENMTVLKIPKSGGVVNRDKQYRRQLQLFKVRDYFYGTQHTHLSRADLNPYSLIIGYGDIQVRKVGEELIAPSSALPLGTIITQDETKMIHIEVGTILMNSVLAISNSVCVEGEDENEAVLNSSVAGFIYMFA